MLAHSQADSDLVVCSTVEAPAAPGRILLVPWGQVKSASGDFVVNESSGPAILAAMKARGTELPIDKEHATLGTTPGFEHFKTPDGSAPAMGWIRNIEIVPHQGIYGDVSWTPQGARYVQNREYRYLSPVTRLRKADRLLIELHSAALTNKPAIFGMPPIANKHTEAVASPAQTGERTAMNPLVAKALGLAEDATETDVLAALNKLQANSEQAKDLREGLVALAGEVGDAELGKLVANADPAAAISALKVAAKTRSQGAGEETELKAMKDELAALKIRDAEREWDVFLAANKDSVELVPALQAEQKKLFLGGHAQYVRNRVKNAPKVGDRAGGAGLQANSDTILITGRDNGGADWRPCAEAAWKAHSAIRSEFLALVDDDKEAEKCYQAYVKAHKHDQVKLFAPALQLLDPYAPAVLAAHAVQTQYALTSRAIIGTFYERLAGSFDASWVSKVGMSMSSDQESETYKWLGQVPAFREWIGGRQAKGLRDDGLTITNKLWESTLKIGVDDLRRDKTGQIRVRIAELAARAAQHWEKLVSDLVNAGGGATLGLCYDGQYFFDTDHASGSSGAQKNLLTSSEVAALDVTTATAPTAVEMAQAILGIIAYQLGLVDDQGEPINGDARQFLVMVAPSLAGAAMAACMNSQLVSGSGMVDNPLKNGPWSVMPVVNPRLTSAGSLIFTFRTDGATRPFILQEEEGVKVDAIAEGSEYAFDNRAHKYGVTAIRNAGYGMWQHATKSTLS